MEPARQKPIRARRYPPQRIVYNDFFSFLIVSSLYNVGSVIMTTISEMSSDHFLAEMP